MHMYMYIHVDAHTHKCVLKENNALSELHCLHVSGTYAKHLLSTLIMMHVYMYMYITSTKAASSGDSASYVMVGIYSSSLL